MIFSENFLSVENFLEWKWALRVFVEISGGKFYFRQLDLTRNSREKCKQQAGIEPAIPVQRSRANQM